MKKRLLSLVLVLCMVLTLMPVFTTQAEASEAWLWPVNGYYGMFRGFSTSNAHKGIDINAPLGTTIRAAKSGTVVYRADSCPHTNYGSGCHCNGGAGNYILVRNDDGSYCRYLHMQLGSSIGDNSHVNQGEYVGRVGSSGDSTGPHLHFEILNGGNYLTDRVNCNPTDSRHSYNYTVNDGPAISYIYTTSSSNVLELIDYNIPGTLNVGDKYSIYGMINSGSSISSVTVGVYDTSGNMATGKTVSPGSTTYNIHNVDNYILFNNLSAGTYYYRVTATNGSGTKQLLNHQFVVKDPYVPPALSASVSSVNLNLKGTNTATITYTASGSLPDWYALKGEVTNGCASTSWGSWNGSSCPLYIEGKKVGTGTITINLCDANDNVLDTTTVQVTVDTKYCTVTLDANGGSVDPSSIRIEQGNSIVNLPEAARTDYHFDGWYTAASGGSQITSSTVFNSNQTIYAHWTPVCNHQWQTIKNSVDTANKKPGVEATVCVYCGKISGLVVTPFASGCRTHDYVTETVLSPNCQQVGLVLSYCKNCGQLNTKTSNPGSIVTPQGLPYGDHDLTFTVTSAPSCGVDGSGYAKCSVCGQIFNVSGFAGALSLGASTSEANMFKATTHKYQTVMSGVDLNGDGVLNFETVNGMRDLMPRIAASHYETVNNQLIKKYNGEAMGSFSVGVDNYGQGYTGDKVCTYCGMAQYGTFISALNNTHKCGVWQDGSVAGYLPYVDENGNHVDGRTDTYYCSKTNQTVGGTRIDYDEYFGLAKEGDIKVIGAVEATCDNGGYSGDHYKFSGNKWVLVQPGEPIPTLGHDFVTIPDRDPSCTESGFHFENGIVCTRCGLLQYDNYTVLPPAGHQWTTEVREEPTCQKTGLNVEVCSVCGEEGETTSTPKLEHVASDKLANIKSATCTEAGYTGDKVCKWCGEVLKAGSAIAATGHSWGEWTVTKAATETVPGEKTRSCTVCGETQKETIPVLSHTHTLTVVAKVDPTCTEEGTEAYWKCSGCGKLFSDAQGKNEIDTPAVIEALGHDYKAVVTAPTCTEKGHTTHTCSRCDASYVDSYKNALGHSYSVKNKVAPTCTETGYSGDKVCKRCGDVLEEGSVIPAAGHDWSEWAVIRPATASRPGAETRTCSVCGETETREIPYVSALAITTQPVDYTGAVNSTARFTVVAEGEGLHYQWEVSTNGGRTWSKSSVTSAVYAAKLTSEKDGRMVRCVVTDASGKSVTSDAATMHVAALTITQQPVDYTSAVNSQAVFTVAAKGTGTLHYQWEVSTNGGRTWSKSSVTSARYSAKLTAEKDGRMVRCVVTDDYGNTVTSNAATMRIQQPLTITTQPVDYTGAVDSTARFTVAAVGTGTLHYQWEVSTNSGKTWSKSSVTSAVYAAKLTAEKDGRMVRCIVSDDNGSVTSQAATMRIQKQLTITQQPVDYNGALNSQAVFTVAATGSGTLHYQWQVSTNGGKTWSKSSVTSARYAAKLTSEKDGRMVRCIVTDNNSSVISEPATMKITTLSITKQPVDYKGALNSTARFTVVATGEGLSYQWQVSTNGGRTWSQSSVKSAVYAAKLTAEKDGRMVRCIVTDANGKSVTSSPATMRIG